jgi:hypothetical protein
MSLETLNNISHALNISTDWILEGNLSLTETTSEIGKILEDCSEYERCRIFEAAREIKRMIREISDKKEPLENQVARVYNLLRK